MARQTTIRLDESGSRRSLQIEENTDAQLTDLIEWGFGKNLTEITRHLIRQEWQTQYQIQIQKRGYTIDITEELYIQKGQLHAITTGYNYDDQGNCIWITNHWKLGNAPANWREWLTEQRATVAREMLNEHPDGGYFVGTWDEHHNQWIRGLTAEDARLTGCHSEFSRAPFPGLPFKSAYRHLMQLANNEVNRRVLLNLIRDLEPDSTDIDPA